MLTLLELALDPVTQCNDRFDGLDGSLSAIVLAGGADRLVARGALKCDLRLVVPLPTEKEKYLRSSDYPMAGLGALQETMQVKNIQT